VGRALTPGWSRDADVADTCRSFRRFGTMSRPQKVEAPHLVIL
jgi:hypothetical protein